jgi:hypothetical protein
MNMKVINRLTAICTIIHNQTESITETQILSELPGNNQQMSQQLKMNQNNLCQQADVRLFLPTVHVEITTVSNYTSRIWIRSADRPFYWDIPSGTIFESIYKCKILMKQRIIGTCSSASSDLDSWGIGLRGITKKWVGACGFTSLKATHCKSRHN